MKLGLIAGAALLVGGAAYAETLTPGVIYCAPSLNASGELDIECENVASSPSGGGGVGGGGIGDEGPGISPGIQVNSATYGGNCGATHGNQTYNLGTACDGALECSYVVDYRVIGDPAPGCAKNYMVTYHCAGSKIGHSAYAGAEAGFDSVIKLKCD
jgi:hypothetical protein